MSIRPATENDHDSLRDLWLAFQDEVDTPDFLRESWEQLSGEERRFYLADLLERVTVYDDHVELALSAG